MTRRTVVGPAALLLGLALLGIAALSGATTAQSTEVTRYVATEHKAELRTTLPLTGRGPYRMRPIYALDLGTLKPGEVWQFNSDGEVTSELPYVTMFATALILTDDPESTSIVDAERPGRPQGTNFTNKVHHLTWTRSAAHKITDPEKHWLVLMGWTASTAFTEGAVIQVMPGYGGISAARIG